MKKRLLYCVSMQLPLRAASDVSDWLDKQVSEGVIDKNAFSVTVIMAVNRQICWRYECLFEIELLHRVFFELMNFIRMKIYAEDLHTSEFKVTTKEIELPSEEGYGDMFQTCKEENVYSSYPLEKKQNKKTKKV